MTKGELIKTARKQAGLTQKQLSEIYEIPRRTLEDWETGRRNPIPYVVNLLLRCLAADYPREDLSEQEQEEPTYTFYDQYGKPLSQKLAELVRVEFIAGRVQTVDICEQDTYGEPTGKTDNRLYQCTETELDSEIPFGFMFKVKKEV